MIVISWNTLSVPASASSQDICGNGGSGYCLYDWNDGGGSGSPIKMYYGNSSNEEFTALWLDQMCANGYATSTCPIDVPHVNLSGGFIVELSYINGGCIATTGTALAVLGTCADPSGNGGSDGVIMVEYHSSGVTDPYLADRYWTNRDGQIVSLASGGNPGQQAFYAIGTTTALAGGDLNGPIP